MLAILFLAQTAAASPPKPDLMVIEASSADAAAFKTARSTCHDPDPSGEEVVVCARMTDLPKSLEEQAAIFDPKPFRPAWRVLGGEGGVAVEQRSTLMGSAPAVMATFKLKF